MYSLRRLHFGSVGMVAGIAMALCLPAQAEDSLTAKSNWPEATLSAQASHELRQDMVTVTLAKEVSDPVQAAVVKSLSEALNSVMKQAKEQGKVKARSGNYHVWPHNDDKGAITQWRGRAEIILVSKDFAAASELAAKLGDRMPVSGMGFSVAPETRAAQEQELLAEAAKAFESRALAVAQAFGFESWSIKHIDMGDSGTPYQPRTRMMAVAASLDSASPELPLEPGTEKVAVTVQGVIFLHSKHK